VGGLNTPDAGGAVSNLDTPGRVEQVVYVMPLE
jgi:hypothetical protein